MGTDRRDWAASLLARLKIEEAGVEPIMLEPIVDTDVFGALAAARLGRTRPLAAVLRRICSDRPPEMFWGSPWTAYDGLAQVRPVPESLRSWLLARLDDESCHAAKVLIWAVTGVADAQGHPITDEPEDASPAEPRPSDPRTAERVGRVLIERPFDENGQLSVEWHELSALRASPPALAAEIATRVVAEASELNDASDPMSAIVWGNKVSSVLEQLPTETLPLGRIYTLARRSDTPVMADEQLAWLFSASGPQRTVAELAPLVEKIEDAPARIDLLRMIAASMESPRTMGAPMLGAGPGGGAARPESIPTPVPAPTPLPERRSPRSRRRQQPSQRRCRRSDRRLRLPGEGWRGPLGAHQRRHRCASPSRPATVARKPKTRCSGWASRGRKPGPPGRICSATTRWSAIRRYARGGPGREQVTGVSGTGRLALPAKSFELDIEVNVDGFETRDGQPRFRLPVSDDDPYPLASLALVPLADPGLEPIRTIGATFFVDGVHEGLGYRLVRVVRDGRGPRA